MSPKFFKRRIWEAEQWGNVELADDSCWCNMINNGGMHQGWNKNNFGIWRRCAKYCERATKGCWFCVRVDCIHQRCIKNQSWYLKGDLFNNERFLKVVVCASVIKDCGRCLCGGFCEKLQWDNFICLWGKRSTGSSLKMDEKLINKANKWYLAGQGLDVLLVGTCKSLGERVPFSRDW